MKRTQKLLAIAMVAAFMTTSAAAFADVVKTQVSTAKPPVHHHHHHHMMHHGQRVCMVNGHPCHTDHQFHSRTDWHVNQ